MVALTGRGDDLMARAGQTFAECEHAYEELLGRAVMGRVRRDLDVLRVGLDSRRNLTHRVDPVPALDRFGDLARALRETPGRDVREPMWAPPGATSHIQLLTTSEACGMRLSEIARELRVTRQAVSATAQELEGLGYVERRPRLH